MMIIKIIKDVTILKVNFATYNNDYIKTVNLRIQQALLVLLVIE